MLEQRILSKRTNTTISSEDEFEVPHETIEAEKNQMMSNLTHYMSGGSEESSKFRLGWVFPVMPIKANEIVLEKYLNLDYLMSIEQVNDHVQTTTMDENA